MAKLTGAGRNKFVSPGIRTGSPNKATSPGAANQIGAAVAFAKEKVDGGKASQLGNALVTNVGKGSPGASRTTHACGSQGTHGPVAGQARPQGADILSSYGPERKV